MSLTLPRGPLSARRPREVNFEVAGPKHLLFFEEFPRRVRAVLGGDVVADSRHARLLHESGLLPQLYFPDADIATELLEPTDQSTHCPFKGDASYWTVKAGGVTADNAAWAYPSPKPESAWLRGWTAFYWEAMDTWFDEDEQVHGHLRDPYHRVDVRSTGRRVRVTSGDDVLADSTRAKVLSETGLPNRYYLPREDVRVELRPSETAAVCPYKGTSSYWSTPSLTDAAWSYEQPLEDTIKVAGHVCFLHDDLTTDLD